MAEIKWSLDLRKWAEKLKEDIPTVQRKVAFQAYSSVVKLSPVQGPGFRKNKNGELVEIKTETGGRLRGNWNVSVGSVDESVDESRKTPQYSRETDLPMPKGDESIFISNSLPYAHVIEYGLYPSPPKNGTYNKKGQAKTSGGYSIQAAHGMVGVTMAKIQDFIDKAVKETQ